MKTLIAIPARLDSQRLPDKVLRKLGDKTMLQRVFEVAVDSKVGDHVIIATDSMVIADHVRDFGGEVVMTSSDHTCGTDRIAEAARQYPDYDVIINLQADQPFLHTEMLEALVQHYKAGRGTEMATIAAPIADLSDMTDPHTVKVIRDHAGRAIYFSRSAIPYGIMDEQHLAKAPVYHHLGLYAFTKEFLQTYTRLSPTPLEQLEQLEQLRALEHGYRIQVNLVDQHVPEINTEADILQAQKLNLI